MSARTELNFEILFREWYILFEVPKITDITDEKFRSMLKVHIFPAFGTFDIKEITTEQLQKFFNGLKKSRVKNRIGYSSDFIGKMKNLLNRFFQYAVKKQYVTTNPISDVIIEKNGSGESNEKKRLALRPETRVAILEWIEDNPLLKPILITCNYTGLRPQELITLKWADIDFDTKVLSVKTALNRVVEFDNDWNVVSRGIKVGKTKTPKSVRLIKMPPIVIEILQEWKQYCTDKGIESEFVFANSKNGEMRSYSGLRSLFRRFVEKHNLQDEGATLYTFRHTFATILLEQRENPKIVMNLMGHTKVKTTLDLYSHVVDDAVYEVTAQTLNNVYMAYKQKKNDRL